MIRYRLDDLGWYQFEWLIQSLLKAELGLTVESWGGRGDFGRDAYCTTALKYPKDQPAKGPFLFQVKFVENANAAGAVVDRPLTAAVAKELAEIKKRKKTLRWIDPNCYTLTTNAPVSAELKEKIRVKVHRDPP